MGTAASSLTAERSVSSASGDVGECFIGGEPGQCPDERDELGLEEDHTTAEPARRHEATLDPAPERLFRTPEKDSGGGDIDETLGLAHRVASCMSKTLHGDSH